MNAPMLNTFSQQRDYIIDKLGLTEPLSRGHLERIEGEVSFSRLHKLEVSLEQCSDELKLLPESARLLDTKSELLHAIKVELEPVREVLDNMKREAGERAIRDAKSKEVFSDAKAKVHALCDELNVNARKYNSRQLAELSDAIRGSINR